MLTLHPGPRWSHLAISSLCLAPLASAALAQPPAVVEVAVDSTADSARCVLTHSRPVGYVVEESRGRVRVRYAEPVDVRPPSARFEGPILERYRLRGARTLSLDTGPAYERYETFELRHPFRLVLDLRAAPRTARDRDRRESARRAETIIVLDPGHGGVEEGAVGPGGLREKEITLDLARRLKGELERGRRRRISVVLTRDEDRLVGLEERTAIANHNRAALFLSIHVNASPRLRATGAETYYLSTDATDDEARILAALENRDGADDLPPDQRVAQGSLDLVLWDLAQNQYLAESSALAESIQRHLNRLTGTRDRGVRQAPFRVLMGAMMPAVLVEVGFISNPDEERLLADSGYRSRIVSAMAAAVEEFLRDLERYAEPGTTGLGTPRP